MAADLALAMCLREHHAGADEVEGEGEQQRQAKGPQRLRAIPPKRAPPRVGAREAGWRGARRRPSGLCEAEHGARGRAHLGRSKHRADGARRGRVGGGRAGEGDGDAQQRRERPAERVEEGLVLTQRVAAGGRHDISQKCEGEARGPEDGREVAVEEAEALQLAERGGAAVGPRGRLRAHERAEDVERRRGRIGQRQKKDEPNGKEALRELAEAERGGEDDTGAHD